MSIYSMHIRNISRAKGSSSIASLAYITAQQFRDARLGTMTRDYGRRERVEHVETLLPAGAPREWLDPEKLFNRIEAVESAENARTAKMMIVALPREFDKEQQLEAVRAFIRENLNARGFAATFAIHTDKNNNNPHVHILVPNRQIDPNTGDFAKTKTKRVYSLDEHGERIPIIDKKTGQQKVDKRNRKQWKRELVQVNPLDERDTLKQLRSAWAQTANRFLPQELHISEKSLKEQGIDRSPTVHEGYAAREMEKRGQVSQRAEINREIGKKNKLLDYLHEQLENVQSLIADTVKTIKELTEKAKEETVNAYNDLAARLAKLSGESNQPSRTAQPGERDTQDAKLEALLKRADAAIESADNAEKALRDERKQRELEESLKAQREYQAFRERIYRAPSRGRDTGISR